MAIGYNPKIVKDGLALCLDANNRKSYPKTGSTWFDLSGKNNHGVAAGALTSADEIPGTVIRLDNTNNIQVNFNTSINKYGFTLTYWGRGTAVPAANYRRIWSLVEPNATHGYYFISDTREIATPHILHYVKDYSIDNWDTRVMLSQSEFALYQWNCYDLVMLAENNWRSYKNGIFLGTNTTPTQDLTSFGNITRLNIGGVDTKFNMSQVIMYDRPLSDVEIIQNYNAFRGRYGL